MASLNSYISISTLNINGLITPTKAQRLAEWIIKDTYNPTIHYLQKKFTSNVINRQVESKKMAKDIPYKY